MSPRLFPRILLTCVALAAGSPALAAWSSDPGRPLVVCGASGDQTDPSIIPDGHGGAFIVWEGTATEHVLASGTVDPALPTDGVPLRALDSGRGAPAAIPDGAGGALVAWVDLRNFYTGVDLYGTRVRPSGFPDPAWTVNGVRIGGDPTGPVPPVLATDALGGAFVAWADLDAGNGGATTHVRMARLLATGTPDPAWPAEGVLVANVPGSQTDVRIAPDGARGAFVAWVDSRPAAPGVYAQHVLSSGIRDDTWPAAGARLSSAVPPGAGLILVADGAGGAFAAWADPRDGNPHIYAHHVLQAYGADTRWPALGLRVSPSDDPQGAPTGVTDGGHDLILAWEDQRADVDLVAQRLRPNGSLDPTWPAGVVLVTDAAGDQRLPHAVTDGAGGAIVSWSDHRDGADWSPFAQHLLSSGAVDATWGSGGARIGLTQEVAPLDAVLMPNGSGGAIATWSEWRGANGRDIVAQRVDRFGKLGDPAPRITAVRDRPDDQGGYVHVEWDASALDLAGDSAVVAYEIAVTDTARGSIFGTRIRAAHGTASYAADVPTLADSTGGNPAIETITVQAENSVGSEGWISAPAFGYSVDNLAPAAPLGLHGSHDGQSTRLTWSPNREPDLALYRLYVGANSSFVPGPLNLYGVTADTAATVYEFGGSWIKLSAVDTHGNESTFAVLSPASIAGDPLRGSPVVFKAPRPNPARSAAEFDYSLLRDGPATLDIFDARGQRVRRLVAGQSTAGDHAREWDLRDDHGRGVPNGEYFARFQAAGRTLSARLTILR